MGRVKNVVLQILVVVSLVWGAFLGFQIHGEIQVRQQRNPESPGYSDLSPAVGVSVGMLLAQLLFRPFFSVVARAMIPKKPRWSEAVWGVKVIRCCDAVFKFCYYVTITLWAYLVLKDEPWMPSVLGGSGTTRRCWTDGWPFQPVSAGLQRWYLTAISYQLSEVLMLLIDTRHPDFLEMLLHHTVTGYAVTFSYVLGYVRIGSLVLFVHGAGDIFIYASKASVDTNFRRVMVCCFWALFFSYAWFRIYVFPIYLMRSAWVESLQETSEIYSWGFLNFSLCTLLLLHMYWFGLVIKIGVLWRSTGAFRDIQANLSSTDFAREKRA